MSKAPIKHRKRYPDEKQAMFEYLAGIAEKEKKPLNMTELWKNFKIEFNSQRSDPIIYRLWLKIRHQIENHSDFSLEKKILMLIASRTPVSQKFMANESSNPSNAIEEARHAWDDEQIEENDSDIEEILETPRSDENPRVPDSFDNFTDFVPIPDEWDFSVEEENEVQVLSQPNPNDTSSSLKNFLTQQKSVLIKNNSPEFQKLARTCQDMINQLNNHDKLVSNVKITKIMKNAYKELTK